MPPLHPDSREPVDHWLISSVRREATCRDQHRHADQPSLPRLPTSMSVSRIGHTSPLARDFGSAEAQCPEAVKLGLHRRQAAGEGWEGVAGLGGHRLPGWFGSTRAPSRLVGCLEFVRSRGARPSGASMLPRSSPPGGVGSGVPSRRCSSGGRHRSRTGRSRSPVRPRPDAMTSVPHSYSLCTTPHRRARLREPARACCGLSSPMTRRGRRGARPAGRATGREAIAAVPAGAGEAVTAQPRMSVSGRRT